MDEFDSTSGDLPRAEEEIDDEAVEWHDVSDAPPAGQAAGVCPHDFRVVGAGWAECRSAEYADHYVLYRFAVQMRVYAPPPRSASDIGGTASPAAAVGVPRWRGVHLIRERYSTARYRHRNLCRVLGWATAQENHRDDDGGAGGHGGGWELDWLRGGGGFPPAYHLHDMTRNDAGMLQKRWVLEMS